ncbi:hypothetical protein AKJ16_DCAP22478 [Drosera capensis]
MSIALPKIMVLVCKVIRKGQITLNVDQPLEEVDAMITELGCKMYYDKMTRERYVDMKSLMQGIFSQGPQGKSQSLACPFQPGKKK